MSTVIPLIVNPSARRGRAGRRARRIRELFAENGVATRLQQSRGPGDVADLVESLARDGAPRIIVAGGDGTIHEAVNGVMRSASTVALGLVPAGSGNDFAKACGIDPDWQTAASRLAERIAGDVDPTRVDLGRCNDVYFANGVGIGFDAVVSHHADGIRLPLGSLVYMAGLLRALAAGVVTPVLSIEADGFTYTGRATLVNVASGPWVGGQFRIAPDAKNDDGIFDLVLAEPLTRRRIITLVGPLKNGTHLGEQEIRHAHVTRVVVESEAPIPSHIDGEVQPPAQRFDIECLPGALRLL